MSFWITTLNLLRQRGGRSQHRAAKQQLRNRKFHGAYSLEPCNPDATTSRRNESARPSRSADDLLRSGVEAACRRTSTCRHGAARGACRDDRAVPGSRRRQRRRGARPQSLAISSLALVPDREDLNAAVAALEPIERDVPGAARRRSPVSGCRRVLDGLSAGTPQDPRGIDDDMGRALSERGWFREEVEEPVEVGQRTRREADARHRALATAVPGSGPCPRPWPHHAAAPSVARRAAGQPPVRTGMTRHPPRRTRLRHVYLRRGRLGILDERLARFGKIGLALECIDHPRVRGLASDLGERRNSLLQRGRQLDGGGSGHAYLRRVVRR